MNGKSFWMHTSLAIRIHCSAEICKIHKAPQCRHPLQCSLTLHTPNWGHGLHSICFRFASSAEWNHKLGLKGAFLQVSMDFLADCLSQVPTVELTYNVKRSRSLHACPHIDASCNVWYITLPFYILCNSSVLLKIFLNTVVQWIAEYRKN